MTQSASTQTVGAATIALLFLVMVPGRLNNHGAFTAAPLAFEHGWPLVWLDREIFPNIIEALNPPAVRCAWAPEYVELSSSLFNVPPWAKLQHWPYSGTWRIRWVGAGCDLLTTLMSTWVVTRIWTARSRIRRYYLRSLLIATAIAAVILAGYTSTATTEHSPVRQDTTIQRCWAPIWIRMLVGEPAILCRMETTATTP